MAEHSNIHFLAVPAHFREKERLYLEVRRREGRVFPDEVVRQLPYVSGSNPYAKEWRRRKRSFERFLSCCKQLSALRRKKDVERTVPYRVTKSGVVGEDANNGNFRILDIGCGNGWMANRLAENPDWDVWAMDVNEEELTQGARLFGRENLQFVYADLMSLVPRSPVPEESDPGTGFRGTFDIVVLAASVQYFPDLKELIFSLKKCLKPGGEIHILDSPFYKNETARAAARQRTLEYYSKMGVPEMAAFYYHHLQADVEQLGGVDLNKTLFVKLLQKIKWLAPFPWVVIG
ncbi:MAG TPA: class I SAM-dependent methyltransferase [Saprospiraceae bacterium]|nr:class I SAM-dependent methyltransferase [Saprospiraceae bacterium]